MIFDGDRERFTYYIRDLADRVGLKDWRLVLLDEMPANADRAAECHPVYGRRFAQLRFSDDWATNDPDQLRRYVVHELLHCHFEPLDWVVNNTQPGLGNHAFDIVHAAFVDALEVCLDAIATEWAETLPLPVMAKPKRTKAA